jgi:hypothetical protein
MARALLQTLERRTQRLAALVDDQRKRVVGLKEAGCLAEAAHASELLTVYEETLAAAQHMLRESLPQ